MIKAEVVNASKYSGTVTFSLLTKGVLNNISSNNTGTRFLMDAITAALCGYEFKAAPEYIDIVNTNTKISVLNSKVKVTGKVWGGAANPNLSADAKESAALFNAVIINNQKRHDTADELTIQLLTGSNQIIAEMTNENVSTLYNQITPTTDGIVTWQMTFKNC